MRSAYAMILLFYSCTICINAFEKRDTLRLASELSILQQTSTGISVQNSQTIHNTLIPSTSNIIQPTSSIFSGVAATLEPSLPITASINEVSKTITSSNSYSVNNGYPDNGLRFSDLPTSSSFGNTVYPGSVIFQTPKPSASVSPLYPIQLSVNITFKWQYTALRVRPANVTLNAVGPNSVTYNITTVDGATSEAIWNLGSVPTNEPLLNGYYRIELYDQRGLSADIQPGWMEPCTTLTVALYSVDSYDPYSTIANYCPTCFYSGSRSKFNEVFHPICIAFGVAIMTCVIFLYNLLR